MYVSEEWRPNGDVRPRFAPGDRVCLPNCAGGLGTVVSVTIDGGRFGPTISYKIAWDHPDNAKYYGESALVIA